jgi:opacity protein-like surface antigen
MKRVMLAAALASLLLGSSPSPAAAEADVRLDTGSAEVSNMLAQGCDEYIRFAGTVRFVFARVSWGVDTFLSNVRIVDANLVGVGETSGTTYRLVSILGGTAMERDDRAVSGTNEVTLKIFGGGEIYSFKALGHLTVALNGEVTASFGDVRQDGCSA